MQQFRRNIFALHSLSGQSVLDVTLQAGLSILKNHGCQQVRLARFTRDQCSASWSRLASILRLFDASHTDEFSTTLHFRTKTPCIRPCAAHDGCSPPCTFARRLLNATPIAPYAFSK